MSLPGIPQHGLSGSVPSNPYLVQKCKVPARLHAQRSRSLTRSADRGISASQKGFRCKFSRERSWSQSDGSWIGRDDLSMVTQTIVRATNPVLAVSSR